MASDIKTFYNLDDMDFDVLFSGGDLEREEGLTTAIYMSLFTDRRAENDDIIKDKSNRKGWWGDELETNKDKIGSRLWILSGKATQQEINLAKDYIKESLKWMLDDGVCKKITVDAERQGSADTAALAFSVKIQYFDGNNFSIKFKNLWENQLDIII